MRKILLIALLVFGAASVGWFAGRNFNYPYPAPTNMVFYNSKPVDFAGFLLGMRKIFADITWLQTLQYYGGGGFEDIVSDEEYKKYAADKDRKGEYGKYSHLLELCRKTVGFDPYFKYVYLFGSASLAWNLTRYDEALDLLNEGIKYNPTYYPFHLYAAAIVYSKEGNAEKMIENLEAAVRYKDCPFEVKLILGNFYMKNGRYEKSADIWLDVYKTDVNAKNRTRAKEKIIKLIEQKKLSPAYVGKIIDL